MYKIDHKVLLEIKCCDFVQLTFVKESPRNWTVNCGSTKDHSGIEIEKFIAHRSLTAMQGSQGRMQAEREAGPGAHAFISVHRGNALGFLS